MKQPIAYACFLAALACAAMAAAPAAAQDRIYRCGNEYTNGKVDKRKDCKLIEGGNVTVISGYRAPGNAAPRASGGGGGSSGGGSASAAPRNDSPAQRARDADARAILENELQRAESVQAQLEREYNNGQPEKNAIEMRNPAFYNDRVSKMKDAIDRNKSDIEGIRRELARIQKGS